jgi:type I restriction enzyme S subunit
MSSDQRLELAADVIDSLHQTPKYSETGLPMVRVTDVKYGVLSLDKTLKVTPEIFSDFSRRYRPTKNDIIVTRVGSYGIFSRVLDTNFCLGQNTAAIIPKTINPRYLYAALNSSFITNQIEASVVGSTQKTLSIKSIKNLIIPRFDANTEKKIAEIAGALEDRIELLRETNKTFESIAQAIFKSWFVDFDPVHAKAKGIPPEGMDEATAALFPDSFEETELGMVPKGWSVQGLDQIATYLNGLALQKFPPTGKNDLPVIKIAQLRKGDTHGADLASRAIKTEYVIKDGDVLFSWSGSLEVELWCGGEGALNQHLFKVTSEKYPKWFYYLWTRKHLAEFRQVAASKATTMGHIQRSHLTAAKVIVPATNVLGAANNVLQPIIDRIILNTINVKSLSGLRDTLLPRLISGQLRIEEAQEMVESV